MYWLRRFDWESRLRRIEAAGAGLGLLLVVLTLTPQAAKALGPWVWFALAVGFLLFLANTAALLWAPATGLWNWIWIHSPIDIRVTRKTRAQSLPDPAELGFLDYELGFKVGMAAVNEILTRITKETEKNTRDTNTSTERLKTLVGAPVEARIRGAKKSADAFTSYAKRLERLEAQYRAACQQMTTNFLNWIRTAPEGNDFQSFDPTLSALAKSSRGSRASTVTYRDTIQASRNLKVSQDVNGATDRVIAAVNKLIEDIDGLIKFCGEGRAAAKGRLRSKS